MSKITIYYIVIANSGIKLWIKWSLTVKIEWVIVPGLPSDSRSRQRGRNASFLYKHAPPFPKSVTLRQQENRNRLQAGSWCDRHVNQIGRSRTSPVAPKLPPTINGVRWCCAGARGGCDSGRWPCWTWPWVHSDGATASWCWRSSSSCRSACSFCFRCQVRTGLTRVQSLPKPAYLLGDSQTGGMFSVFGQISLGVGQVKNLSVWLFRTLHLFLRPSTFVYLSDSATFVYFHRLF